VGGFGEGDGWEDGGALNGKCEVRSSWLLDLYRKILEWFFLR
jgi:hypothetical protein